MVRGKNKGELRNLRTKGGVSKRGLGSTFEGTCKEGDEKSHARRGGMEKKPDIKINQGEVSSSSREKMTPEGGKVAVFLVNRKDQTIVLVGGKKSGHG